jgi:hypothetical protein
VARGFCHEKDLTHASPIKGEENGNKIKIFSPGYLTMLIKYFNIIKKVNILLNIVNI